MSACMIFMCVYQKFTFKIMYIEKKVIERVIF